MKCSTLLVEHNYIDADYLDDFAGYYVRCFADYQRRCKRIHFFTTKFDVNEFERMLKGGNDALETEIQKDYLGFCVARPLPEAIIGRTLLKTYPPDEGRRNYPCTRTYRVNLFGIELVLDSLAFQEQDTVLAACATVALWSCFHKTSELFDSALLTPGAITRAANLVVGEHRPIPSHGLRLEQICNAIKQVGLEPELIEVTPELPLTSLCYAYLQFGIPVVLVVKIPELGGHAITLNGYSVQKEAVTTSEIASSNDVVPMVGRRIDEFFAHDDQVGPFSKLAINYSSTKGQAMTLTGWLDPKTSTRLQFSPVAVVIPVYNKIRLTFIDAYGWIERLHNIFQVLGNGNVEWDIHLAHSNTWKSEIRRRGTDLAGRGVRDILTVQHPRFVWRAVFYRGGQLVAEILTDATDMQRSFSIYELVWHNPAFKNDVARLLQEPLIRDYLDADYPRLSEFLRIKTQ